MRKRPEKRNRAKEQVKKGANEKESRTCKMRRSASLDSSKLPALPTATILNKKVTKEKYFF